MKNAVVNIAGIINTEDLVGDMRHIFTLPADHEPLFIRMIERIRSCHFIRTVIVTKSKNEINDPINNICKKEKIIVCETEGNQLDEDYRIAANYNVDLLLKISLNSPLIDPLIINRFLSYFVENQYALDYLSNMHTASYLKGNELEILSFESLKTAWENANSQIEREKTSFYILNNPDKFSIENILWEKGRNYSKSHRWNLIYEEDYLFVKKIFAELFDQKPIFGVDDILFLLNENPYLNLINSNRSQIKSTIYKV